MARSPFNTNRGSIGAVVTQGGRFGPIQRERVTPVNPQTTAQQVQRMRLGTCASEWRGITSLQRAAWESLAAQLAGNLTGFQLYVKVNTVRLTCGQAKLEDAPLPPAFGVMTTGALTVEDTPVVSIAAVTDTIAPDKFMIEGASPVSAGITNRNAAYRLLKVVSGFTGPAAEDIATEYVARFGALTPTQKVSLRITPVVNGFKGVPLKLAAIVGATPLTAPTVPDIAILSDTIGSSDMETVLSSTGETDAGTAHAGFFQSRARKASDTVPTDGTVAAVGDSSSVTLPAVISAVPYRSAIRWGRSAVTTDGSWSAWSDELAFTPS